MMYTSTLLCLTGKIYFGNGDGLLFHDFVNGGSVGIGHFIELVDAANALIGQHKGSTF